MNIYFFSERTADPKMLQDLGGSITVHFKDSIKDIQRRNNEIVFTETRIVCGQQIKICHMIPADSIVVVDGPILLQDAWLKAGVATLLIPEMKQETGRWGSIVFKYCGLLQLHRIEVGISQWTSTNPTFDEKGEEQVASIAK